jgi:hypothetical protein
MRHIFNPARFLLAVVLVSSACGASETQPKPEEATPEQQPVFGGDKVTLPPQLAGLEFGMTLAEAQAIAPSMNANGGLPYDATLRMSFAAGFSSGIERFSVSALDMDMVARMTELWGPPRGRTYYGNRSLRWWNPEAELRATVQELGPGRYSSVEFTQYRPIAKFLGDGPDLAFQTKGPLLGMTSTELEAAYGEWLTSHWLEKVRELGAEAEPPLIKLPPIDWENDETQIGLAWEEGKIDWFGVDLVYGDDPAAKAELMALMVAKWGEATEGEPTKNPLPGAADYKSWTFSRHPDVRVEDHPDYQEWWLTMTRNTDSAGTP